MAFSFVDYVGDGSTVLFSLPFPYLSQADISVKVNSVTAPFTWSNSTTVSITTAPPVASVVEIRRTTNKATLNVVFQDGSVLGKTDLNNEATQLLYIAQEAFDVTASAMNLNALSKFDALGKNIQNVADPVLAQDAATKNYVDTKAQVAGNVPVPGSLIGSPAYWLKATGASTWAWARSVAADISDASAFGIALLTTVSGSNPTSFGISLLTTVSANATAFGLSLLTAASAAVARALLGVREVLTANRTYFVLATGNDSNTGLVNNAGGAWLTLQHAANYIAQNVDTGGFTVTVQVGPGTFAGVQMLRPFVGTGWVLFSGDTTTPSNVVINNNGFGTGFQATFQAGFRVQGFKIADVTMTACIYASAGGLVEVMGNMEYGAITSGSSVGVGHLNAGMGGVIVVIANYTISGGSYSHFTADKGGHLETTMSAVTITGTPAFTGGFAFAYRNGVMSIPGVTFTGSATGARAVALLAGVIDTGVIGGSPTYFPGSTAVVTGTGGQYN